MPLQRPIESPHQATAFHGAGETMTERNLQAFDAEIGFWQRELDRRADLLERHVDPAVAKRLETYAEELRRKAKLGLLTDPGEALRELSQVVCQTFTKSSKPARSGARA